jgi:hypothetical protein
LERVVMELAEGQVIPLQWGIQSIAWPFLIAGGQSVKLYKTWRSWGVGYTIGSGDFDF